MSDELKENLRQMKEIVRELHTFSQQYENIGLGGVKRELEYLRYQTFKLFDNFIVNNGKKVAEKAAGLIPFVDYNYDDWEEQSQKVIRREAALNQIYKLTGDEYETRLYSYV